MPRPLKVGVLASGEGTTFEGLADAIANDAGSVRIAVVVSDRPAAPVLERARARGLPTAVVPVKGVAPEVWSERLSETLSAHGVELVVLAGFLPILPSNWVAQWRGRAINTHPSLLPRYGGHGMYGRHVHEAVLAAGDRESGVTVHLITDALDAGPPISQERAPVLPGGYSRIAAAAAPPGGGRAPRRDRSPVRGRVVAAALSRWRRARARAAGRTGTPSLSHRRRVNRGLEQLRDRRRAGGQFRGEPVAGGLHREQLGGPRPANDLGLRDRRSRGPSFQSHEVAIVVDDVGGNPERAEVAERSDAVVAIEDHVRPSRDPDRVDEDPGAAQLPDEMPHLLRVDPLVGAQAVEREERERDAVVRHPALPSRASAIARRT